MAEIMIINIEEDAYRVKLLPRKSFFASCFCHQLPLYSPLKQKKCKRDLFFGFVLGSIGFLSDCIFFS